jgi:hypothetical protein
MRTVNAPNGMKELNLLNGRIVERAKAAKGGAVVVTTTRNWSWKSKRKKGKGEMLERNQIRVGAV